MVQYLYDTFTGATNESLDLHDPDVGDVGSWGSGGGNFELDGVGNVRPKSTGALTYGFNTSTHASEDYEVQVKGVLNGTTGSFIFGAAARVQNINTMYVAWIKGNGGFQLKYRDGSSDSGDNLVPEVTGVPITAGAVYTVILRVEGTALTARLVRDSDSVELVNVSTTNSALSTGDFGIISFNDTSDVQDIDVNSLAPPPTTTFTSDVITNNSGTVLANQLMSYEWYPSPNNRIGSLNSTQATTGTETTDANGHLTITVPAGDGTMLASVDGGSAALDSVYYEAGTSS